MGGRFGINCQSAFLKMLKLLDRVKWGQFKNFAGIFPSTFPQLVNSSKNSILNWVMKLNFFMFFSFFNCNLNRSCLVYMFSLCFLGSKVLINPQWQFLVHKIFSSMKKFLYASSSGICSLFNLQLKLLFPKCITYVLGCPVIKTCSLTGC